MYVAVGLWYTVFFFHLIYSNTDMSCEEPVALFIRASIMVRNSSGNCGHVFFPKRSELYCGLFSDCLTVCFSLLFCISYYVYDVVKSSRSLSHLLVSFLLFTLTDVV